jgi:sensor histidine kinase YesM
MAIAAALARVRKVWSWQSSRSLLFVAGVITVIISLFEITLDPLAMLREVVSNFITCLSITFIVATLTSAVGMVRLGRDWKRFFLLLALLALGGMLGGLLSWAINDLFFSVRMTHPYIFLLIVAVLAIIFGLAFLAYENVSLRLDEAVARLAEKKVQEEKLLRLKTKAELEALRARVNPHFLFNTLNSVASLIPVDPPRAEALLQRMSNLFRYILSAGDRGFVPLDEELDIVDEYLAIEKVRLGARLDYFIDRGDALDSVKIPGMLLQPLIENSVKYGIAPQKNGGRIEVTCRRHEDRCAITISDTGKGFDLDAVEEGFGIGSVRQRLELDYPGSHVFDITVDGGVKIDITLPITHEIQNSPR